jgi:hypothetical protein
MDKLEKLRAELTTDRAKTKDALNLLTTKLSDTRNTTTTVWQELKRELDEKMTSILVTLQGVTDATALLTNQMEDHKIHLDHLMSFEEQRRAQMDNHWRRLEELQSTIDGVQTTLADDRANSITRSKCLLAQLDGLRSTTEQATSTDRSDIIDIRARMIPKLRSRTKSLTSEIHNFHTRLDAMTATTPRSVSITPSPNDIGNPMKDTVIGENVAPACVDSEDGPPATTGSTTMHVEKDDGSPVQTVPTTCPTHRSDQLWYARP